MNVDEAISWVRDHGAVLEAAKGPIPRLTEWLTGEPVKGSWWTHSKSHEIFAVLQMLHDSPEVLVCRLVNGHITLIHSRLWPALVRMATLFHRDQLAQVQQRHTAAGRHVNATIEYPTWVPSDVMQQAPLLSEQEARSILGPLANVPAASRKRIKRMRRQSKDPSGP